MTTEPGWGQRTKRFQSIAFASGLLALGGCCSDVDETLCIEWAGPTCPTTAEVAPAFAGEPTTFRSEGTFWPAHEYLIEGAQRIEPAQCCYDVTVTRCSHDLR